MRGTELIFETSALASPPGRSRIEAVLTELFRAIDVPAPVFACGGVGVVVPAEPIPVFRALQAIDSHWYRLFALVPSESTLSRDAARLGAALTVPRGVPTSAAAG